MSQPDQELNTGSSAVFDSGRLLHAYLVVGPDGTQRDTFTDRLAAALVCSSSGTVPCGLCADCRKAFRGVHPDIIRRGKPADKAVFPVELIRAVCADSAVMPNEAGRKVYILTDGERMNAAAQNALLKTLEDPPPHCAFILPVADPSVFLPTVRSRCAQLRVPDDPAFDSQALADAERFLELLASSPAEAAAFLSGLDMKKEGRETFFRFLDAAAGLAPARMADGRLSPAMWSRLDRALGRAEMYRVHNLNTGYIVGMLTACLTAPAGNL